MTGAGNPLLEFSGVHVSVGGKPILKGLDLSLPTGAVHAVMGPNGSGKSTLANVLAGREGYEITAGDIRLRGRSILADSPEERSRAGIFLAFQYPVEIPGVSNIEFLKASIDAQRHAAGAEALSTAAFMKQVRAVAKQLDLEPEFLKRGVNEGFSGGEKKRNEILQLLVLEPSLAVLDETDSGLDIDALKTVADGINHFRRSDRSILLVTHYQRLLDHVVPDRVHVLADGRIVRSGDKTLAVELEARGYGWLTHAA